MRDCQPVMAVHHEERVPLHRDRNGPATRAEDLRLQLRYPVGINFFGPLAYFRWGRRPSG